MRLLEAYLSDMEIENIDELKQGDGHPPEDDPQIYAGNIDIPFTCINTEGRWDAKSDPNPVSDTTPTPTHPQLTFTLSDTAFIMPHN